MTFNWSLVFFVVSLLGSGVYFGVTTQLPSAEILAEWVNRGSRIAFVLTC